MGSLLTNHQFLSTEVAILSQLLQGKRSPHTRRAYIKDLRDFFWFAAQIEEPTETIVQEFLSLDQLNALSLVLRYKSYLVNTRGLKEATVNRRLAALKSLVSLGNQLGCCSYTLVEVKGDKVIRYRDTSGVEAEVFRQMLAIPNRTTLRGKRDYALLRLLWDNVLRRGEIEKTDIRDFDATRRSLWILGKGKGQQKQAVTLSLPTLEALSDWLQARGKTDGKQPLFIALDRAYYGHRLSGTSIYKIVDAIASQAGVSKKLSPHRIRHSGITAALDATNGDVRKVQKLSRHADLNTLMLYDDNRKDVQGEVSDILAGLV
jgi:integrase/recombinase XerC